MLISIDNFPTFKATFRIELVIFLKQEPMKNFFNSFLILLMSVSVLTLSAQQREVRKLTKANKTTPEIKTESNSNPTTIKGNKEQYLQSENNNTSTEVISTGYMTGTPEKAEVKTENKLTPEMCKELINAFEKKIEITKSNPEEHKKAKKSGWYKQTEKEIKKLKSQLKELEKNKK